MFRDSDSATVRRGQIGRVETTPTTLLESSSAARFQDLCLRELTLDASHINWFMTANDSSFLPGPLLSRMTVLQIEPPNKEQTHRVFQNIYKNVC